MKVKIKRWAAALSICIIGAVSAFALTGCKWYDQQKCNHEWDDGVVTKEATCRATGERTFTCTLCEKTETETIAKLPHEEVEVPAVEPQCGVEGKTEYVKCNVCEAILVEAKVLPAIEHDVVVDVAVEVTCTSKGYTEGSHCARCNKVLVAQEEIPATGHEIVTLPASDATCTSPALGEGQGCSKCGKVYIEQREISPALGHKFEGNKCTVCNIELDSNAAKVLEIYGTSDVTETAVVAGQAYAVGSVIRIYRASAGDYNVYAVNGNNAPPFLAAYSATLGDEDYDLPFYWSANSKSNIVSITGDFAVKAYHDYVDFYIGNFTAVLKNGTITYTLSVTGETFTISEAMGTASGYIKILSLES